MQIEETKRNRDDRLNEKFEKSVSRSPSRDPRHVIRNKRLLDNLEVLEQAQVMIQ